MNVKGLILAGIVSTTISCQSVKKEAPSFDNYPVREGNLTEMDYTPVETKFSLWSPIADEVKVLLYESGHEGSAYKTIPMKKEKDGTIRCDLRLPSLDEYLAICKRYEKEAVLELKNPMEREAVHGIVARCEEIYGL